MAIHSKYDCVRVAEAAEAISLAEPPEFKAAWTVCV